MNSLVLLSYPFNIAKLSVPLALMEILTLKLISSEVSNLISLESYDTFDIFPINPLLVITACPSLIPLLDPLSILKLLNQ